MRVCALVTPVRLIVTVAVPLPVTVAMFAVPEVTEALLRVRETKSRDDLVGVIGSAVTAFNRACTGEWQIHVKVRRTLQFPRDGDRRCHQDRPRSSELRKLMWRATRCAAVKPAGCETPSHDQETDDIRTSRVIEVHG